MKRRVSVVALLFTFALLAACGGRARPIGIPHSERTQFQSEWTRYLDFESHKALAVAGDPDGHFTSGFAFAQASRQKAVQAAMKACAKRRLDRRIEDDCRLYAVENEVQSAP